MNEERFVKILSLLLIWFPLNYRWFDSFQQFFLEIIVRSLLINWSIEHVRIRDSSNIFQDRTSSLFEEKKTVRDLLMFLFEFDSWKCVEGTCPIQGCSLNPGQGFVTSKLDSIARDFHCPIHFLSKSGIKLLLLLSRYIIVIRTEIQNVLLYGRCFIIK